MKPSTLLNILRIFLTLVWRLMLTAATVAALCIVGVAMVLSLIFNGPSDTARDRLTLTLLDSQLTQQIPGFYLTDAHIEQIRKTQVTLTGHSAHHLVDTAAQTTLRATTFHTETYTAQIMLLPANSGLQFAKSKEGVTHADAGDRIILAPAMTNPQSNACFLEDGFLLLSTGDLEPLGIDPLQIADCGPILILNGQVNEALFAATSGYSPRAAIGQAADGTVILVTTDGWNQEHIGATCQDMMNIMKEYGAVNACLLNSDTSCVAWLVE